MKRFQLIAALSTAAVPAMLAMTSCTTEAYCFVCEGVQPGNQGAGGEDDGSGGTGVIVTGGSGGTVNFGGEGGEGGVDDGPACDADLESDPLNCGECGNVCSLLGAFAACSGGECVVDECADGYADLNGSDTDGCEYKCPVFPTMDETCNSEDDNCDGEKDEGIDLDTVENCGSCGNACDLANAVAACEEVGGQYQCVVDSCTSDAFEDIDDVAANGCEYTCPDPNRSAEVCNAIDDDCDGVVNEDEDPTNDEVCTTPYLNWPCPLDPMNPGAGGVCDGICQAATQLCVGTGNVCFGGQGPEAEICDEEDNDCDGATDEGFDTDTDPLNCGACGNRCNLPNAIAECVGGECKVLQCKPGFEDLDGDDESCEYECEVQFKSPETCNGIDDDCDGVADDNLGTHAEFCVQDFECAGSEATCLNGEWICDYPEHVETGPDGSIVFEETLCDDEDNDCDGQVDETFPTKGQECESPGNGICVTTGNWECNDAGDALECPAVAAPGNAVDEICNGLDDNCDGNVDERFPKNTTSTSDDGTCTNGGNHTCLGLIPPMLSINFTPSGGGGAVTRWVFQYEASRVDAETTDIDNSRACSKPGVLPWTSVNQAAAAAACAALTNSAGQPMRLCTEEEWQVACSANTAGTLWSYSSGPTTYTLGACNDYDLYPDPEDVPQAWLTGFDNGAAKECHTTGGGGFFDMSGNVSEWTSTSVSVLGETYYRVRGGSYLTYGPATSCDASFVLNVPDFQNQDVGFRCCSDAAP